MSAVPEVPRTATVPELVEAPPMITAAPTDMPAQAARAPSVPPPPPEAAPVKQLDEQHTLIPDAAWSCGMPDGIPGPLTGTYVFDIDFIVGETHELGVTPYGRSSRIEILGGAIDGAALRGNVAAGGIEDVVVLENGVTEVEQIHLLTLGEDNVFMHNYGVAPAASAVRMVLGFEAASGGPYAFLNDVRYVASRVYDAKLRLLRLKVRGGQ